MKTMLLGLMLAGFAISASAVDKAALDNRIHYLMERFEALQAKPDKAVPPEMLKKARGIVLLDRTKAGFIFAYQGGGGVAMVRDAKNDKWSPPAFLNATEASLGFQVGGEQAFFVILLMNTNSTHLLTDSSFEFGGEARGTAGNESAGEHAEAVMPDASVLVYYDRKGLYGGAAIKGGALAPDPESNRVYYDDFVSVQDILFNKKVKASKTATALTKKLNEQAKRAAK